MATGSYRGDGHSRQVVDVDADADADADSGAGEAAATLLGYTFVPNKRGQMCKASHGIAPGRA
jgi:hypothetical protein